MKLDFSKYKNLKSLTELLEKNNFKTFIIGGAVRDILLNIEPKDFDIVTSALPEEIEKIFKDYKIIKVGKKFGIEKVIFNSEAFDIATFREEDEYIDSRHPEKIIFSKDIHNDLKRRDFTINGFAYNIKNNEFIDDFNGLNDLRKKIIRTIGDPKKRFSEDALRILRALRFASVLGFSIEEKTKKAIFELKNSIKNISAERIESEFSKFLMGKNAGKLLREYRDIFAVFIPEFKKSFDFDQQSKYHKKDCWEHCVSVFETVGNSLEEKYAGLFHDIGKPYCFVQEDGFRRYPNHEKVGSFIAEKILSRLKVSKKLKENVGKLIKVHDIYLGNNEEKYLKKLKKHIGNDLLFSFANLRFADSNDHDFSKSTKIKLFDKEDFLNKCRELLEKEKKISLKNLNISGNEIKNLGFKEGPEIGKLLKEILELVKEKKLENNKKKIEKFLKEKYEKNKFNSYKND